MNRKAEELLAAMRDAIEDYYTSLGRPGRLPDTADEQRYHKLRATDAYGAMLSYIESIGHPRCELGKMGLRK